MTTNQHRVLTHMDEKNLGAILLNGEYQFKQDFRDSEDLANKMCDLLDAKESK